MPEARPDPSRPDPSRPAAPVIAARLTGVDKRFGGALALDGVHFEVAAGEIHALLGENGAGKSTLLGALGGMMKPDAGQIEVEGQVRVRWTPRDAAGAGVRLVHQQFVQSEPHTALQNLALGWHGLGAVPDWEAVRRAVSAAADEYGLKVTLDTLVRDLPVGERQKLEVLRALFHGARLLLLDEPTAVLSGSEVRGLMDALRRFRATGGATVFTSHKLDEVRALADRITVLRKGRIIGTFEGRATSADDLATLMVGRPISRATPTAEIHVGAEVLALHGVTVRGAGGRPELMNANLRLCAGQVLGIAGVSGSGQLALAELIAGSRSPSTGKVRLFGHTVTRFSPAAFSRLGVAYIPEDRHRVGAVGALSVLENLVLRNLARDFSRWGVIDWVAARAWATGRINEYGIVCASLDAPAATLSGGNLQKLILARELSGRPELIVAAYPTRGLDLLAAEAVRERLLQARWAGGAVVLISEDLDEIFRMSDQVAVVYGGRVVGVAGRGELNRGQIGLWMGGRGSSTQHDLAAVFPPPDTEQPP